MRNSVESTQMRVADRKVPLLDLKAQFAGIRTEVMKQVEEVFESQHFINGPKVEELERKAAEYCGCSHGIGVSSGTDALLVALMALGIGPGDEVITSTFTFFATAGAIHRLGARPVFVDIEPESCNMDPSKFEAAITPRTKAVIPVHLFGQCAEMETVLDIARRHDIFVVEDAAQAIGAEYRGKRAGSMGQFGCFSFFPSKNLGGAGDGGFVSTCDPALAEKVKILRNHGSEPKYYHHEVGGNFRLDALQAAVLLVKLPLLDGWSSDRQKNASEYREYFSALNCPVTLPTELPGRRHIYNQFCIQVPAEVRPGLMDALKAAGIGAEIYYPVPLHLQKCFSHLGYGKGDCPVAEAIADRILALPIYPESSADDRRYVAETIASYLRKAL